MAESFEDGKAKVVLTGREEFIDRNGKWYDEKPTE